ncbi:MAG: phospholipase C, phosphocholine-specific [Chryseolinea sp.]
MESRRDFLKKAASLSGLGGMYSVMPLSVAKAFSINPPEGTTFMDAEHVVILMQENRSFDHCYGSLAGVRGFNDPRYVTLPDKKPVWMQTNEAGETYIPFRFDIKQTKATWMGSLPHGWTDQVDVRNGGRCDQWLTAKKSGHEEYKDMPLTLGFYNREDLPFYYAMADSFTVCDQNFCSSLAGTTPNRLYLWTGKVREDTNSPARIRNEETDYDAEAKWKTFPERLEENGVSWKIYQNELSVGVGFEGEEDDWLSNFTDNPIEWFAQFHVKFHPAYIEYLPKKIEWLKSQLGEGENKLSALSLGSDEHTRLKRRLERGKQELEISLKDVTVYTRENWDKLPQAEKDIHLKAFTTNIKDPDYHSLATVTYDDNGTTREMKVPKGDVLFQFRKDVNEGKLPTVSWLVPPSHFSDHPGSPWYGAWYLSESIDILTKNPEVWKKTIFILCYDENDGYFDHVPPFVPPVPNEPSTGRVSPAIDPAMEYVPLEMDLKRKSADDARGSAIGLGYRVPLVVASPWSRGGVVNSQVFDHTSILMFLEKFLSKKTGKHIEDNNISSWRRAVCGDLTSVFRPYTGEMVKLPEFVQKNSFYQEIHQAQFKKLPAMPSPTSASDIARAVTSGILPAGMPMQENGTRVSSALPYELYVTGNLADDRSSFRFQFDAKKEVFGDKSAGAAFNVYALSNGWATRSYAVAPGESVSDDWSLANLQGGRYHFRVDGPNGFMREYRGMTGGKERLVVEVSYEQDRRKGFTGNLRLNIVNNHSTGIAVEIVDNAYGQQKVKRKVAKGASEQIVLDLSKSHGWYDTTVRLFGVDIETRFAGRVETGKESVSDPAMVKAVARP